MANEAEQAIANRLASAPTFHPVTADLFVDDWGLDAGDIVTVSSGETDYSVPIYNMSLDWHGSSMAQIQSTGNKERKPLSALKRKQFASGRSGYGTKKTVTEQGVIYSGKFELTDRKMTSTLSATGVKLDANGYPVMVYNPDTGDYEYEYDEQGANLASRISQNAGAISLEVTRAQGAEGTLCGAINVEAGKITQIVSAVGQNGQVTAASVVLAINAAGDSIFSVNAGTIALNGSTVASSLQGEYVECDTLVADGIDCNGDVYAEGDIRGATMTIGTSGTGVDVGGTAIASFGTATASGGAITIPTTTLDGSSGSSITFNIADTSYYQDHVGISSTGSWTWDTSDEVYYRTITARDGSTSDIGLPTISTSVGNWSNNVAIVTVNGPGSHAITTATVNGSSIAGMASSDPLVLNGPATGAYTDGTDQGTLAADRYYQVVATPKSGSAVKIKFKTPAGATGGISSMSLSNGYSSEPSADYSGSVSSNLWYVVTATPNSGSAKKLKFHVPSTSYNYTPADIRIGNISYYASLPSGGTTLDTLATSIHANKGKSGYVRIVADLDGYSGTPKYYYIPMSGI